MPCDIRFYDTTFSSLTSTTVRAVAIDVAASTHLCISVANGPVTGGYGVHLPFSTRKCVYQVSVTDRGRVYAGLKVSSLNADVAGQLEVVLQATPTTSVGTVSSAAQLATFLQIQPWSFDEMQGVLGLIDAYRSLRNTSDPVLLAFSDDYAMALLRVGINAAAL